MADAQVHREIAAAVLKLGAPDAAGIPQRLRTT
jgi:hypothetical protein